MTKSFRKPGCCLASKGNSATTPRKRPYWASSQENVEQLIRVVSAFPSWERPWPESDNREPQPVPIRIEAEGLKLGMNSTQFDPTLSSPSTCECRLAAEPDYGGLDSAADIIRDAARWGLIDDLRRLLGLGSENSSQDTIRVVRDIAYEFAGAKNRDLAVDLFVHVTGIAEFGPASLREYGHKHGCTHEWFRRKAEEMRQRLDLPRLASQRDDAIRAEHRLVNRRNDES